MQLSLIMQKSNENTLADKITACFEKKPKKAYFFFGNLKENGFKILEEELIDTTTKYYFAIGIDKKNTTRIMLDSILDYSKDVYYYSNNGLVEFTSNICIFEYTNEVYMYVGSSNMSESGIIEDLSVYSEIVFDLNNKDDKTGYKAQIKDLTKKVEEEFTKLNKTEVDKLVEEKEIFTTRQYNHNVKSISELLNSTTTKAPKKEMSKEEIDEVYVQDKEIPKVDLSDLSLDIDLSGVEESVPSSFENENTNIKKKEEDIEVTYDEEEFNNMSNLDEVEKLIGATIEKKEEKDEVKLDVNNEFYDASMLDDEIDTNATIDINDMLFSKADVKLDVENIKKEKRSAKKKNEFDDDEEKVQVKKVNLNNISNFIFELPSRPLKEQDQNVIKIPNYIRTMIPEFFGFNEKVKNVEINGAMYKVRNVKIEVIDVGTGAKYTDRDSKIMSKTGQTYITFSSDIFKNIIYSEKDIIRMIKLAGDIYHIEIIPKDMQEYKLWSKICNQTFKATTRKYGMM